MAPESVEVLKLSLHGVTIGYLAGYQNGRNILAFDQNYAANRDRPTLTLSGHHEHPAAAALFNKPWITQQRLHPVLSNLLPEGALRDWFALVLKVHRDNEFPLFAQLAADLPGALVAEPIEPENIPEGVLKHRNSVQPSPRAVLSGQPRFSLAGVQMKFSMHETEGRYQVSQPDKLGEWIIKTPSTHHKDVPINEYSMMSLASLVGVDIPEIKLVPLERLQDLPPINLPNEKFAYAIRRFDRDEERNRIHTEDFAQVLFKYAHEKYGSANFEQIGKIVYKFTQHGLSHVQQFARRLLANVLLGNGDAHLKNWSLLYPDRVSAELAPAYDIVYTQAYINNEAQISLNMAGEKNWYKINKEHFASWSNSLGIPWRAINVHLDEVMDKARSLWPAHLETTPMNEGHKKLLKAHWKKLHPDFRITK